VRKIISEGGIGSLVSINAQFSFSISDEANIRLSKELAGGSLMDVGCYCINAMRLLTGAEPVEAQGFAHFGETTHVDESFAAVLKFPGDVLGHFHSGLRSFRINTYDVKGSEGRLLLEQAFVPQPHTATTIKYWQGDKFEEIRIAEADHYELMAEDFADALLNKRPPRFPPSDAVANMKVIEHLLDTASY
jgi:predicted dehydrogenase